MQSLPITVILAVARFHVGPNAETPERDLEATSSTEQSGRGSDRTRMSTCIHAVTLQTVIWDLSQTIASQASGGI